MSLLLMKDQKMQDKNLMIYGWRGINHSVALVNQNQIVSLQKFNDLKIYHLDAPFHNPNWNVNSNVSGFEQEEQLLINKPIAPTPEIEIDCVYTATFPFDLFFKNEDFRKTKKVLNFIVTEFGLVDTDFVSKKGNVKDYLKNDDQIIVPSNWSKNKTIEYGFPESKVKVISHGINPKIFYPSDLNLKNEFKKNLGLDKDSYLFVNMGSMTWNKGIDLIVDAFIILRQKYSHIRLLLKDQSNLYGIQSQNIISQVLSKKPHLNQQELLSSFILINTNLTLSQLRSIYAGADCYLSPYRAEGFNLTVLEALACGSEVIVTEGGATDDFCYHSSIGKVKSNLVVSEELNKSKGGNNLYYLEPELDSLVDEMEKKILQGKLNNSDTATYVRDKYSWDRIAEKLYESII